MPFEIVRNDIVNMKVDAIVNTANPKATIGYGVDAGIHKKAGHKLFSERKKIGSIGVGKAVITSGYDLEAKYVIHTVGPVWQGGEKNEEKQLMKCYENSLKLALGKKCESIAFPLISAGNHGFPKPLAMQVAINAFSKFLMKHEMRIYLVVFSNDAFALSEKLFKSVQSYIDEKYIFEKTLDEYGVTDKCSVREAEISDILTEFENQRRNIEIKAQSDMSAEEPVLMYARNSAPMSGIYSATKSVPEKDGLESLLKKTDAGFSETLLKLIDNTGKKDSDIYKKANIDRKLFSKIRNNPAYKPSKPTALAFAIALELSLDETKDFIARAGYALTHSSKFDIIIEYFITNGNYDMFEINETLFAFDQNLLGA